MEALRVTIRTKVNPSIGRLSEGSCQLIPGLPDDIVLDEIVTKFPWSNFHILPRLNRRWQQAVREKEARWEETLIVLHTESEDKHDEGISVFSTRDKCSYRLPYRPRDVISELFRNEYQCVSSDGKIYVLAGGALGGTFKLGVHVFDMAVGKRQWKQCTSMDMNGTRVVLACGVFGGKLYVFGGVRSSCFGPSETESEVYDAQADNWTVIAPMRARREVNCHVATIGEEMFVYAGCECLADKEHPGSRLDIYHPGKNEWRVIESFGRQSDSSERMFVADGKFYSMTADGIYVHDDDINKNSWTELHSFPVPPPDLWRARTPILVVEGKLIVVGATGSQQFNLYETDGFLGKNKEMVWKKTNCPLSFREFANKPHICSIQLF